MTARRSFWAWGLETDEPTNEQRQQAAARLSARYNREITAPPVPRVDDLRLRAPRAAAPASLAGITTSETYDRAWHSYGRSYRDVVRAVRGEFENPPDVVAYPRTEAEVVSVLEWCGQANLTAIPYGGGALAWLNRNASRYGFRRTVPSWWPTSSWLTPATAATPWTPCAPWSTKPWKKRSVGRPAALRAKP